MTVSTTTNKDTFTGTGANTVLSTTFPFIDDADLLVTRRVLATGAETTMVLTTDYTVTGGSFATGTVTPVNGAADFPLDTVEWVIERNTPQTQATDYIENDDFGGETHEKALDKGIYISQEQQDEINRSLKVPVSDDDPGELPSSEDRASQFLAFDASGDPIAAASPAGTTLVSAFMATMLDDVDAAAGRATLEIAASLLPRSYGAGCQLTRTDANTITVAVGEWLNTGGVTGMVLAASLAKDIDATWVAGAGGGLNATDFASGGSDAEASTWYHVFLIEDGAGTVDVGFDKNVAAANLLTDSGYTNYRRIGSVKTDGSKDILDFTQYGDRFLWVLAVQDINIGTAPTTAELSHTLVSAPLGIRTAALVAIHVEDTSPAGGGGLTFTIAGPGDHALPDATVTLTMLTTADASEMADIALALETDTAQIIKTRSSVSSGDHELQILVFGWIDTRGRDD